VNRLQTISDLLIAAELLTDGTQLFPNDASFRQTEFRLRVHSGDVKPKLFKQQINPSPLTDEKYRQ